MSVPELAPRMFSFNSPYGACPECDGLGVRKSFDRDADPRATATKTLREGALALGRRELVPGPRVGRCSAPTRSRPTTPYAQAARRRSRRCCGTGRASASSTFSWAGRRSSYEWQAHVGRDPPARSSGATARRRPRRRREELEKLMAVHPCPACQGARLKPETPRGQASAGRTSPSTPSCPSARAARLYRGSKLDARERAIAGADPQGDPRAAGLPRERRPRLPHARSRRGDALGGRGPAHPPRDADRLAPDRRAVHPRRAVDRPAPARQPQAARHAAGDARPRATP